MAMAMRVAGNKEGKGGKVIVTATSMAGKWTAKAMQRAMKTAMGVAGELRGWQRRGQW
jgi:hypothetical protein